MKREKEKEEEEEEEEEEVEIWMRMGKFVGQEVKRSVQHASWAIWGPDRERVQRGKAGNC